MKDNRKQQIRMQAERLADWLNGPEAAESQAGRTVRFAVSIAGRGRLSKRGPERAQLIEQMFAGGILGYAFPGMPNLDWGADDEAWIEQHTALLQQHAAKGSWLPMKMRAELRLNGGSIAFALVPEDEGSRWLQVWGELNNAGLATRLRVCPRCHKFWYCAGRSDRDFCSALCKVLFWQKTPHGRKVKREYMRKNRADRKRLWEGKRHGRTLRRGRNIHISLKKGE